MCVAECPSANEFGVRNNPVCVDEVDTTDFQNLTDIENLVSDKIIVCSFSRLSTDVLYGACMLFLKETSGLDPTGEMCSLLYRQH